MNAITEAHIKAAMTYPEYKGLIEQLLIADKTTGENQSKGMIEYTRLGVHRMSRMEKKSQISDQLLQKTKLIREKWYWVVFTEAWCGEAAQTIPVLHKITETSGNLELKLLLRDEFPDITRHYMTRENYSIPMMLCLHAHTLEEIGIWGPRPAPAEKFISEFKSNPIDTIEEFVQKIHAWYNQDKGKTLQLEIGNLIEEWVFVGKKRNDQVAH